MGEDIPPEPGIEYGDDCGFCNAGETPQYIIVTLAGLQVNTDCIHRGANEDWKRYGTDAVNGTYLLVQREFHPCNWHTVPTRVGDFGYRRTWTGGGCHVGNSFDDDINEFYMIIKKLSATSMSIHAHDPNFPGPHGEGFFDNTLIGVGGDFIGCIGFLDIPNLGEPNLACQGGTATIQEVVP